MTGPNPLREDEVEAVARAIWESSSAGQMDWNTLDVFTRGGLKRDARAAITALDQVRENRAASPQQQAYEAQSALGIAPLPGYPVDQIRPNR